MPRCHVNGTSRPCPVTLKPSYLTMSVVIAEHSSVYAYPESHQFIRAAANSPYMRTVRKERRQIPQVYWMNLDYALLTQPDMFHLIDNVGGNNNNTANMMIMKFHL